ncbi:Phosphoglycerate kinase [Dictyocoela muelleri]|nr:Phosphoglycerate kinase [Dictyocoela muelleri]
MRKRTIDDIKIFQKVVYLRVDYNVPIKNNVILDDSRIKRTFPTIARLLSAKQLIIGSHLGRPKGQFSEEYSLRHVFDYLKNEFERNEIFKNEIDFYQININRDFRFNDFKAKITLLENLRFYENDRTDEIDCDFVVMDGFGVCHRNNYLKHLNRPVVAGYLIVRELDLAQKILNGVDLIILGGKKIEDKVSLVEKLLMKCNHFYFCGAIANEMQLHKKKLGIIENNSESEKIIENEAEKNPIARIFFTAKKYNKMLYFPVDGIDESKKITENLNVPFKDIGPKSINELQRIIMGSESIFWNGTPGVFEEEAFEFGTKELVKALAREQKSKLVVIGGGDTGAAVKKFDTLEVLNNVSTGGGALLKFLEGGEMFGLNEIDDFVYT